MPSVWSKSPFLTPFWDSEVLDPRHFGPLKSGQKMVLAKKIRPLLFLQLLILSLFYFKNFFILARFKVLPVLSQTVF